MKYQYQLDVRELKEVEGLGTTIAYYSKGHHDFDVFSQGVLRGYEYEILDKSSIEHTYYRNIPHPEFHSIIEKAKPGKGAYPVTVFNLP